MGRDRVGLASPHHSTFTLALALTLEPLAHHLYDVRVVGEEQRRASESEVATLPGDAPAARKLVEPALAAHLVRGRGRVSL